MNESQELVVVQPTQLATRVSPMDALALMSDQEFEQRLDSLKIAQRRMERIQRELMKEGVDYGVIPGTGDKPTLYKPGAERLCKFHHLVPTFDVETVMGDGISRPHFRVLTTCSLHYESEEGPIVAQGMGAANSWERKYRWRDGQRKCPHCGAATIIKGQEKYGGGYICWAKRGGCGAKFTEDDIAITAQQTGQIENPDPFDLENTIRKISAKRSQTDATLRATATSGLFSQDLEDIADTNAIEPRRQAPKTASSAPPKQTEPAKPALKPTSEPVIISEAEQVERVQLMLQIEADRQFLILGESQLNVNAVKHAGVKDWRDASTEYLKDLAARMKTQREKKEQEGKKPEEGTIDA